ncbi:polynucleotide adenylyltransferase [Fusarium acutatum]|uniref:Polynucleotide adenylyltransferase n=1 Tax=Fusarium acutatum TaxID=78861 RepID=A0A8H4JZ72_9HYPO|nr:polynucleotide adenylyltransferase [Fusarium acutatum]
MVETNRVDELPEDYAKLPTKEPLLENAFRIRYLHEKSSTQTSHGAPTTSHRIFAGPGFTQFYGYYGDFFDLLNPQKNLYRAQLLHYNQLITPSRGDIPHITQLPPIVSATQAAPRSQSSSKVPPRDASANTGTPGEGHRNR